MAASNPADLTQIQLRENLELQLSEVEMLRSMYPEEEEFNLDEQALLDVQEFCSGRTDEKKKSS